MLYEKFCFFWLKVVNYKAKLQIMVSVFYLTIHDRFQARFRTCALDLNKQWNWYVNHFCIIT